MRPNYPFNCWYVAATTDEVGRDLLARRLLGIPVVLYRRSSGDVVAMEDRCVHRAYPLSEGRLDGDRLVCGYHGFVYDPDGRCVDVPSQERVPQGACVRTYAVHEQPPFVWIWLGEPGAAALRQPPRTPWFDDPQWASTGETLNVGANYLLLHEHYLDLTNVFVMHPEAVPPGTAPSSPTTCARCSTRWPRGTPRSSKPSSVGWATRSSRGATSTSRPTAPRSGHDASRRGWSRRRRAVSPRDQP